jgi:hypothetical protein
MNKYQKFILERTLCFISKDMEVNDKKAVTNYVNDDEFMIQQDENYNIKKHNIIVGGLSIDSIEIDGKKCEKIETPKHSYFDDKMNLAVVDFDNRAKEITFNFANNVTEPLTLKLKFIESDHASFDAKEAESNRQNLMAAANIKLATGADLVNVYFQPVTENYSYTVIELYSAQGNFEKQHISSGVAYKLPPAKLLGGTIESLLGKFKVEDGMFFKAITGLANGVYGVKITEFDKSEKPLFSSDVMFFTIR